MTHKRTGLCTRHTHVTTHPPSSSSGEHRGTRGQKAHVWNKLACSASPPAPHGPELLSNVRRARARGLAVSFAEAVVASVAATVSPHAPDKAWPTTAIRQNSRGTSVRMFYTARTSEHADLFAQMFWPLPFTTVLESICENTLSVI